MARAAAGELRQANHAARRRGVRRAVAAVLAIGAFWAPGAQAITFRLTTTADNGDNNNPIAGSLREAVINSNGFAGRDVIDATGVSGAIELEGPLRILTDDADIVGPGPAALAVRRDETVEGLKIIVVRDAEVEISGVTIANGRSDGDSGAGVENLHGTVTLRNSVVSGNETVDSGVGAPGAAGINNVGSQDAGPAALTLIDSTVSGNTALGRGAGISNHTHSSVALVNTTVSGNTSHGGAGCGGGGGGGIFNLGTLLLVGSTVSGNKVDNPGGPELGGGIRSCAGSAASIGLVNSTIAENSAETGGNFHIQRFAPATLRSTILSGARGGGRSCFFDPEDQSLSSGGYNLDDDGSCGLTEPTDQPRTDPLLGPLADNGGPTVTHALSPSSPALDAAIADGQQVDQRGLPRPVDLLDVANAQGGDAADVGAFERQPAGSEPGDGPGGDEAPPNGKPVPSAPSNRFRITDVRKRKREGIAVVILRVPGAGEIALKRNRKVKRVAKEPEGSGRVKLPVRPRGKAKRKLSARRLRENDAKRARVRIRARIAYRPEGGTRRTKTKRLKLVRRVG